MRRKRFRKTSKDQQVSQAQQQVSDDELYDDACAKASADYYVRSSKNRIKVRQLDIWIAVGLYLVVSSVAFVVLY